MALLGLCACSEEPANDTDSAPANPKKVLVVGWDGAKSPAVIQADTPNLDRVASWGGVTFDATTQLTHATISGPGWASLLTGVAPDQHGVTFNGFYDDRDESWLTFMQRAHDAGLRTGVAVVWPEIATDIIEEGVSDENGLADEDGVADWMVAAIENGIFDVHFVHQDAPDHAGHAGEFDGGDPDYILAIEDSDVRLGRLIDAVQARTDEDWLIAVSTDHGGSGGGHGPMDAENQTIWTAYGYPGGDGGWSIDDATHMDVHATVLDFLDIEVDSRGIDGVSQIPK
jgi:arylsulfatase A-like enzyme